MVAIKKLETEHNCQWLKQLEALQVEQVPADERLQWMLQQRETVCNQALTNEELLLMLELALHLCDWTMVLCVTDTLTTDRAMRSHQSRLALDAADAHIQRGSPADAIQSLRKPLFQHYQEPELFCCYRFAQQKQLLATELLYPQEACCDGEILLTPLEEYHIDSFRWVYSQFAAEQEQDQWQDQSIAQLCNLPQFENDEHWRDWLHRHQQLPNCYLFAVVHREWGLIGSVSLEIFNGVGFFYYWLGEDFQGMGFGPQSVHLLMNLGFDYLGMHCCYAKVYDYNVPSQKALKKIGFQHLPFKVKPPYDNEVLYYLGAEKPKAALRAELELLIVDMESNLVLAGE